jgi:allophanate hydrolase
MGRHGHRVAGVPLSGPLDRVALTLANGLVGNDANTPALEFLLQAPVLEVVATSVRIAVVGTKAVARSMHLRRGEHIRCDALADVSCGYLAIEGGFAVPPVLGSAATYVRGGLGGLHGGVLRAGDVLPIRHDEVTARPDKMVARALDPMFGAPIRIVLGPQDDHFTAESIATLRAATYTISPQADRMGFRLQGPVLTHMKGYDIVSDGIVPGSIQVPGSGQPIVLLADGQTTGGYPKIATVISADLPLIGRRRPGAAVRFAVVTQEEAEAARREQARALAQEIAEMREVGPDIDHAALYSANLVGGVSDGSD